MKKPPQKVAYLWQLGVFFHCSPDCPKLPRTSFPFYKFFYTTISGRISDTKYPPKCHWIKSDAMREPNFKSLFFLKANMLIRQTSLTWESVFIVVVYTKLHRFSISTFLSALQFIHDNLKIGLNVDVLLQSIYIRKVSS